MADDDVLAIAIDGGYTYIGGALNIDRPNNGCNTNIRIRTMAISNDNLYVDAEVTSGTNLKYHDFFARYNDVAVVVPQLNLKVFLQVAYR